MFRQSTPRDRSADNATRRTIWRPVREDAQQREHVGKPLDLVQHHQSTQRPQLESGIGESREIGRVLQVEPRRPIAVRCRQLPGESGLPDLTSPEKSDDRELLARASPGPRVAGALPPPLALRAGAAGVPVHRRPHHACPRVPVSGGGACYCDVHAGRGLGSAWRSTAMSAVRRTSVTRCKCFPCCNAHVRLCSPRIKTRRAVRSNPRELRLRVRLRQLRSSDLRHAQIRRPD